MPKKVTDKMKYLCYECINFHYWHIVTSNVQWLIFHSRQKPPTKVENGNLPWPSFSDKAVVLAFFEAHLWQLFCQIIISYVDIRSKIEYEQSCEITDVSHFSRNGSLHSL